ncbi:MAG TPA: GTPase, partial [bacterium]|nr:GTPase [bacterium]
MTSSNLEAALPILALVGRPNVGKSTLFNRIAGGKQALVAAIAGVTRDRRERVVARDGLRFRLVDTGGLGFAPGAPFGEEIAGQVRLAVTAADVVWLVVDGAEGLNPYDAEIARSLQRSGKPVLLVVNKAEGPHRLGAVGEFYALGIAPVLPVSALHGHGVAEALEES